MFRGDLPLGQGADYDLCVLYVVTLRQMQCNTIGAYLQVIDNMSAGGVSPCLMKQSMIVLEDIYFYEVDFFL